MPDEHSPTTINLPRQDATGPDMSRQVATSDEYISIKDARQIFLDHHREVTERTLQRYCEKHHLDGKKMLTAEGEKWFVLRSSVLTRINELDEFDKLRPGTTSDDMSAHVAEEITNDITHDNERQRTTDDRKQIQVRHPPTRRDRSRQVATPATRI